MVNKQTTKIIVLELERWFGGSEHLRLSAEDCVQFLGTYSLAYVTLTVTL